MTAPVPSRSVDIGTAISELCDRLVPDRHAYDAIDLTMLAKTLGVIDVLYKASRIHGYTVWAERGPTLFLAMAKTEGRRRATLAHECAHLVLNPALRPDENMDATTRRRSLDILGGDLERFRTAAASLGVERLCDRIAYEMLLPRARAQDLVVSTAEDVRELASRFRVSLALVVNEAHKAGTAVSLLRLSRAWDSSWVVVDTAGVPSRWTVGSACDAATGEALGGLPVGSRSTMVELRRAGSGEARPYSVLRHRTGAIAIRS